MFLVAGLRQLIGKDRTVFAQLDPRNRLWSFALRAGWATHQRVCRLGAPAHKAAGVCSAHTPSEIPPVSCWLPGPGPVCLKAAEPARSEEHTSELQSQSNLVCRLLLEKKKK